MNFTVWASPAILDKDTSTCPPVPAVPSKDGFMTSKDKTTADKT